MMALKKRLWFIIMNGYGTLCGCLAFKSFLSLFSYEYEVSRFFILTHIMIGKSRNHICGDIIRGGINRGSRFAGRVTVFYFNNITF